MRVPLADFILMLAHVLSELMDGLNRILLYDASTVDKISLRHTTTHLLRLRWQAQALSLFVVSNLL